MRMDLIWMDLRTTILIGHEIPGGMYHVHMSELLTTLYVGLEKLKILLVQRSAKNPFLSE